MFDLEKAIAAWRRSLQSNRAFLPDDLDELESHVRDQVRGLRAKGVAEQAAFEAAMREMGGYGAVADEYRKVYWGKRRRRHELRSELTWRLFMFKNYVKIAGRLLLRHKGYASLNILGLATGMAVCLLILLFIDHEQRFDAFHEKADRIYRLDEVQAFGGMAPQKVALSMYPMAPTMQEDFPEVAAYVRFVDADQLVVHEDRRLLLENAFWVDSTFFDVFDFALVQGDPATALDAPGSAVLTEATAQRLFGDAAAAMGKTVVSGDRPDAPALRVTGVLRDVPETSHLQFDAVYALRTVERPQWLENWGGNWLVTYLLLHEGADAAALEGKFRDYQVRRMRPGSLEAYQLFLQPLRAVHLGSSDVTHDYHNYKKFDDTYVLTFSVLAVFVLVIAAINFTNISTARGALRAKEVGVRKAIGAQRAELAQQFLGESVLQAVLALGLALAFVAAALPLAERLTDRDLAFAFFGEPRTLAAMLGMTLAVGLLAGLYPAVFLSSFKAVSVLKNQVATGRRGLRRLTLRNGLVALQFAIAIAMIAGTFLTVQQLRFMQTRDPGFDRHQVVTLPLNRTANQKYDALKAELLQIPRVRGVTGSGQRLGNNLHQSGMRIEGRDSVRSIAPSQLTVDVDYLSFYGIELVAGRGFSKERQEADRRRAFVINEAMAREMGWDDPLGKAIGYGFMDTLGTVVGVVPDFNFNSLHHQVQPVAISMQDFGYSEVSVRIDEAGMDETLAALEAAWDRVVGDRPFEYTFLDEHFAQLYASDAKVSRVVAALAVLAVFIACLGLFGLAAFTAEQRTKEIGIRKVLGASVPGLLLLLWRDFAGLVAVGFVVAAPLAYLGLERWLGGFAYRIDVGPGVFVLTGLLVLAIALVTVSYQSIRAALADPVRSLRYE